MTRNDLLELIEDLWEFAAGDPLDDVDEGADFDDDEELSELYRRVCEALNEERT